MRTIPVLFLVVGIAAAPFAHADDDDTDDGQTKQPVAEIVVTAQRLDTARAKVEPSLGASTYTLSNEAVENRPSGETTNINKLLLQVPGVTQSGSGELYVRSQANLQYRINNVILPEGLTDVGENLSARLAERVQLITGALPAQYGLQVGGIANITTKSGVYDHGGQVELYGGSSGELEPAFEYAGATGGTNFFFSGSYLHSDLGLSDTGGRADPKHDRTDQIEGFAFLDHILDDQTRISLIVGTSNERFQIPYAAAPLDTGGVQRETSSYGIVSYLLTTEQVTLQASGFARYSSLGLHPDAAEDLSLIGLSQAVADRNLAGGVQVEGVYDADDRHALRAGFTLTVDDQKNDVRSLVLPLTTGGSPVGMPVSIGGTFSETRREQSAFVQDEWRPLDSLTVNAGLRFDHVNTGGSAIGPRANLVWTPLDGLSVHVGYARYFVPPPEELGIGRIPGLIGTTGAPAGIGADVVRAERDNYYDIGVEQKFDALTIGLDSYWREATNLIDTVPIGASLIPQPFNYATGRVRGVELSATYAEGPISAWANFAIAEGEGRQIVSSQFAFTPAELAFAAQHVIHLGQDQTYTASAGASYRWHSVQLSGDLLYGSGMRRTISDGAPNGASLPDHVQVDLAAVYHTHGLGGRQLDLRLDVINLLDERYELREGTSIGGGIPQWGPRRGFFAGIEQSF